MQPHVLTWVLCSAVANMLTAADNCRRGDHSVDQPKAEAHWTIVMTIVDGMLKSAVQELAVLELHTKHINKILSLVTDTCRAV